MTVLVRRLNPLAMAAEVPTIEEYNQFVREVGDWMRQAKGVMEGLNRLDDIRLEQIRLLTEQVELLKLLVDA